MVSLSYPPVESDAKICYISYKGNVSSVYLYYVLRDYKSSGDIDHLIFHFIDLISHHEFTAVSPLIAICREHDVCVLLSRKYRYHMRT
jgi:hypothetical protein